jgi:lipid-A-disaccharide synthase
MDRQPIVVGMVAGEASGDFLGAHLMEALRKQIPTLQFVGIGGPKMKAAGLDAWFPMEKLAVRGYVEVLRHFPAIAAIRRRLGRRLETLRPRLFIGIDAPDFNLALEHRLKRNGIPTVHYVSPSLWAWRGRRMRSIAASVSKMLVLFPFEEPLYRAAGVPVVYVGHPLADLMPEEDASQSMRENLRLPSNGKIVCLLPGSRVSELRYMASTFVRTARLIAQRQPGVHFLVPMASRETRAIFETEQYACGASDLPLSILFGHARDAMSAADVVLVASGTATLETALCRKPMVITYKMAELTYQLMSRMRYQPWVGLPNIIAGEFLVPELIQDDATPENLAQAVLNSMNDPAVARRLPVRLGEIHRLLRQDAAARATEAILPWLQAT